MRARWAWQSTASYRPTDAVWITATPGLRAWPETELDGLRDETREGHQTPHGNKEGPTP